MGFHEQGQGKPSDFPRQALARLETVLLSPEMLSSHAGVPSSGRSDMSIVNALERAKLRQERHVGIRRPSVPLLTELEPRLMIPGFYRHAAPIGALARVLGCEITGSMDVAQGITGTARGTSPKAAVSIWGVN